MVPWHSTFGTAQYDLSLRATPLICTTAALRPKFGLKLVTDCTDPQTHRHVMQMVVLRTSCQAFMICTTVKHERQSGLCICSVSVSVQQA